MNLDSMNGSQFENWMPIRTYWQDSQLMVDWCHFGDRRFTHPFFTESVERALQRPFNLAFRRQTPADWLYEVEAMNPGLPPSGFIFHMSRCGSTLMAQMLAALPQNIVLSEATPIEGILSANRRDSSITDEQRLRWLRATISALGRPRHSLEKHLFIKFDSWHVAELPLIRRAFPNVPWIFLYRDPVEVMVSHENMPGAQMMSALMTGCMDLVGSNALSLPPEEFGAKLLAGVCAAALAHVDDGGLLVHYSELPDAVWAVLTEHFGITPTMDEIERMRAMAEFDAKAPCARFKPDQESKRNSATDAIRRACAQWLDPVYEKLEAAQWRRSKTTAGTDEPAAMETASN